MAQRTAKNWTAAEAFKVIRLGIDKEAIKDIAKRYPLFAVMAAKGADDIVSALPDFITARKINAALAGEIESTESDADEPEAVETETAEPEKTIEEKPKGKRGRPAKTKDEQQDEEKPKGKRGRPAKVKEPDPEPIDEEVDEDEQEIEEPENDVEVEETEAEVDDDEDDWVI